MRTVHFAQLSNRQLLLFEGIPTSALIDEVVIARQLAQPILAPKLVESRYAMLAIANQIERRDVKLLRRTVEPRQANVLQKLGMVVQCEQSQALPAQAQAPIGETARARCTAARRAA